MRRSLKNINLVLLVALAITMTLRPNIAHAAFSFEILNTNCNPAADPLLDYLPENSNTDGSVYPDRSCSGRNISINTPNHNIVSALVSELTEFNN